MCVRRETGEASFMSVSIDWQRAENPDSRRHPPGSLPLIIQTAKQHSHCGLTAHRFTSLPSSHEALTQCCFYVGPPSSTSAQHKHNIVPMPRVCCIVMTLMSRDHVSGLIDLDKQQQHIIDLITCFFIRGSHYLVKCVPPWSSTLIQILRVYINKLKKIQISLLKISCMFQERSCGEC